MKNQRQHPYIGVTGMMSDMDSVWARHNHNTVCTSLLKDGSWPNLMLGVLVSSKTLAGHTNKYPHLYPPIKEVSKIFIGSYGEFQLHNLIHYNTDDASTLVEDVDKMVELAGEYLNGFQFNLCWPDPELIRAVRQNHPELYIVLQVGPQALDDINWMSPNLPEALEPYLEWNDKERAIDNVLFDPSGGFGKQLDPQRLEDLVVCASAYGLNVGVAGGLTAKTVDSVKPLVRAYRHLCIDTQSGVRNNEGQFDQIAHKNYTYEAVNRLYCPAPVM